MWRFCPLAVAVPDDILSTSKWCQDGAVSVTRNSKGRDDSYMERYDVARCGNACGAVSQQAAAARPHAGASQARSAQSRGPTSGALRGHCQVPESHMQGSRAGTEAGQPASQSSAPRGSCSRASPLWTSSCCPAPQYLELAGLPGCPAPPGSLPDALLPGVAPVAAKPILLLWPGRPDTRGDAGTSVLAAEARSVWPSPRAQNASF